MSRHDDDRDVSPLDDRTTDRLLSGRPVEDEPGLTAFVQQLQAFTPSAAPAPSAALEELLAGGLPVVPVAPAAPPRRARLGTAWTRLGVAGASFAAVLLGAGAANALPARAQDLVADVVGFVSPFELPRPDEGTAEENPAPVPSPTADLPVVPSPVPSADAEPASRPTRSPLPSQAPVDSDDEPGPQGSEAPSDDGSSSSDDDERSPEPRSSEDDERESPEPEELDSSDAPDTEDLSSEAEDLQDLTDAEDAD